MKAVNILFILFIGITGCSKKTNSDTKGLLKPPIISEDSYLVADSITYDVIIKNLNPDDKWTEKYFEDLQKTFFIDSIFESIYSGKQTAIDYNTGESLSIKQVKAMEKEQPELRNNISKIQFTEEWYLNRQNLMLEKKVKSIILGVPNYIDSTILFGYKPVFKIEMN